MASERIKRTWDADTSLSRRTLMARFGVGGIAMLASSALLAACGGDDDDDDVAPTEPDSTSGAETETPDSGDDSDESDAGPTVTSDGGESDEATAEDEDGAEEEGSGDGEPKRGGVLVNLRNLRPTSFDPHFTLTWSSITYSSPVFSQLVRTDPHKSGLLDVGDIVPDLAESWEISDDARSITFKLREGVTWHNGTPFTAKDVVYSIERMADPQICYFAGDLANLDRVEANGDYEVTVHWATPSAAGLVTFAQGYSVILSADYHPDVDIKTEAFAMGTGPFKLTDYTPGQEYHYERNEDYFLPEYPYLDGLTFQVVESDAMVPALISGQGDNALWVRGATADPNVVDRIRQQAPDLKIWDPIVRPLGRGVYFNLSRPGPLQSVEVRRAMAMVIDIEGVLEVYGGPEWTVRSGFFLPGMSGMDISEIDALVGWDKPIEERVETARAQLEEAGYGDGFQSTALVRNLQDYVEAMTLITESWRNHLGIDVALDTPETAVEVERRSNFDYDILWYFPTMRVGIHPVELASQFVCDGPENWARYCNDELNEIFAEMAGTMDPEKLRELARRAETILWTDVPAIALLYPVDVPITKPDVKGINAQPWLTNEDYLTVWLDR